MGIGRDEEWVEKGQKKEKSWVEGTKARRHGYVSQFQGSIFIPTTEFNFLNDTYR